MLDSIHQAIAESWKLVCTRRSGNVNNKQHVNEIFVGTIIREKKNKKWKENVQIVHVF